MVLLWCTGVTRLPTRTGRQNQCEQQRHFAYVFSTRKNTRFFFSPVDFFPRTFGVADLSPPFWKWQIWDLSSLVDFDLLQKETKHLN